MLLRLIVLLTIPMVLFAISDEPHHTTAYIKNSGELDLLLSYSNYRTDHFWNKHGKLHPTYNRFERKSYLLYAEYAIRYTDSLSFNGGYSTISESLNGNSRGLEDPEIGWKHLFYEGKTSALTSQLIAIIPIGDKKSSIRYGKAGFQLGILYSDLYCLLNRWGWYDLSIAYRYYQGFPSDRLLANIAIGYNIFSRLQILISSLYDDGFCNGKSKDNLNNVAFHPNYRLWKVQGEFLIDVCYASLTLGAFKHLWGRNVGSGGGFVGGIWFDF